MFRFHSLLGFLPCVGGIVLSVLHLELSVLSDFLHLSLLLSRERLNIMIFVNNLFQFCRV